MGSGASKMFTQNPMKRTYPPEDVPTFKIILVGDSNVGKTSIFLRYTREQFDYSYQPTMNVNIGNVTKKVQFPFETLVSVSLWDLPGREEIDLRRSYYKDIDAAIVVVDLSDEGSLEMAGTWKRDILNNCIVTVDNVPDSGERTKRKSVASQTQLPILLIGNKLDKISTRLDDDDKPYDTPSNIPVLEEIALQHNFVGSVAVSACDSDAGVHAAFRSLLRYLLQKKMPKRMKKEQKENPNNLKNVFTDPNQHGAFARNLASIDDHSYEHLKPTRVPEVDQVLDSTDKHVMSLELCCVGLLIAVKNFKKACCVAGITDTYKASIEECITSLKDTLRNGREDDVLLATEEAGYIKLEVFGDREKIPGGLKRVLDIYENEVCKKTRRVLAQCPSLKVNLSDDLEILQGFVATFQQMSVECGLNKKQARVGTQNLNDSIERLKDTLVLGDEAMKITDDQFKKIKNAMMW